MAANIISFVNELIYGDMGSAELGASAHIPASGLNHLRWTLQFKPNAAGTSVTGQQFLTHHLDYMLASYEEWRSKYFLPPVCPWNGQDMYPGMGMPEGPALPVSLNGSAFPRRLDGKRLGYSREKLLQRHEALHQW